jgi:hypothetical protein
MSLQAMSLASMTVSFMQGTGHVVSIRRINLTQSSGRAASLEVVGDADGILNWANGSGVISIAQVTWDGLGTGDAAAGLNVDLTRGGLDDLFFVGIPFTDFDANATFTVADNSGNSTSLTKSGLSDDSLNLYQFAYADFTGNADFTDVRSISVTLEDPVRSTCL